MRGVLVTRPEPGAAETARAVAALGWHPILAPALLLVPRAFAAPPAQAVLITSRAAARALPSSALPVLAVGEATAAEARAQGFPNVAAAAGDAAALAALATATLNPAAGPLLLAVGQGYGQELATQLRAAGFRVLRRIAYAASPAPALPGPAQAALGAGQVRAALFYSPRSALAAMAQLRAAGLLHAIPGIEALAISPRVAHVLKALPWRALRVAARPDQPSLLAELGEVVTA